MSNKEISLSKIEEYSNDFNSNSAYLVAANASVQNGFNNAAINYKAARETDPNFTIELKQGSITNQGGCGRCWLFAACNTFRYELMKKNNIDDFELSQNYLFFWDKIEKANYYYESVIKTVDEPVDGRLYDWINRMPLGDGGQWDMVVNLVNKYGICPRSAYPDGANSLNSRGFVGTLTKKVREDAVLLRNAIKEGKSEEEVQALKDGMLKEDYRILAIALGEPPVKFDWTCKTKDGVINEFGITPKEFFDKYVGINIEDYVSLINAPTEDKPMNQMYTVKFLGNVVEGRPVQYLNLPMDVIKEATIAQLKDGHPVWFGSDCGPGSERTLGVFNEDVVDFESLLDIKFWFTKADKLTYGQSAMNHAMVIEGVNFDETGAPNKWKIENSWGPNAGVKGFFTATDKWFNDYVYQIVVNKKYLDEETKKLLEQPLNELEPWDPMGTLAD